MSVKYYAVVVEVQNKNFGNSYFQSIVFPVKSKTSKEAALNLVINCPRLKKEKPKDLLFQCIKISYDEYLILRKINPNNPFWKNVANKNNNINNNLN